MKTATAPLFQKILSGLFLSTFILLLHATASAQCTNTTAFATIAAQAAGASINTGTTNCAEYNTITGVTAGQTYVSNHTVPSNNSYITVRSGTYNGPVVAHGYGPLEWTATVSGNHYVHYNTNNSCGSSSSSTYNYDGAIGTLQSATNCSTTFTDAGGTGSNYGDKRVYIYKFYPATAGFKVSVAFTAFSTENNFDGMLIYNGSSTSAPLISSGLGVGSNPNTCKAGSWRGTASPGTVTSTATDGALTFVFASDAGTNSTGWNANVTCINPVVLDGITVNTTCWIPNNANDYTITAKATAADGLGGSTYGLMALVNFQGAHAGEHGGYYAWNTTQALLTAAGYTLNQMACTGGGWIGVAPGYGASTATLISGSTSVSGNQRTVNWVIRPNSTFPQYSDNAISEYAQSSTGAAQGWTNFPNLIAVAPTITGTTTLTCGATSDLNASGEWASLPTGGTITTVGNDKVHVFNSSGTFNSPVAISGAQILVVGGGGGGGQNGGGGGGGGGYLYSTGQSISSGNTTVTVGAGGTAGINTSTGGRPGERGGNSVFGSITATGGGGGANRDYGGAPTTGGSGGGGGGGPTGVAGAAVSPAGQGYAGSNGYNNNCLSAGGGGGGAGGTAVAGASNAGGRGGAGVNNSITGSAVGYAGGGAGGPTCSPGVFGTASHGGGTSGAAGTANTGGGGSGNAASGGTGVVIVRYTPPRWTSSNTGVATVNDITGVVTAVAAGTATITFTNESGCVSTTTVTVALPDQPSVISGSNSICTSTNQAYSVTNVSGVTYAWSYSGTGTITGSGNSITLNATSSGTLTVTPSNACGNGTARTTEIVVISAAAITSTAANETCAPLNDGSISSVNISGGLSKIRYIRIKQNMTAAQDGWLHPSELKAYQIFGGDVAQGKTATSSGVSYGGGAYPASNLVDGDVNSIYHSGAPGETEWIEVDLGAEYSLDYIEIWTGNCCFATRFNDLQLILKNGSGTVIHSRQFNMNSVAASNFTFNVLDVSWSDGASTLNRTGLDAGTYTLNYADVTGCSTVAHAKTINTTTATPSSTLTTSNANACHGSTVNLGGNVTAAGSWTVTLNNGTTATGSGNGTWSAAVTPSATTTYTISSVNNGCAGSGTGSTTITLPAKGTTLAGNGDNATCAVKGSSWIHFYHSSGRYLASINPNGNDLGNVTVSNTVGSPAAVYACNTSSNPAYYTAYMGRNWLVSSSAFPGTDFPGAVSVRLPFNDSELAAMNSYATSTTTSNPNDNGATESNMMMTKFTGASENNNASDNCSGGTIRAISQTANGDLSAYSISNAKYIQFNVNQFSEMFMHKNTSSSPLPITLTTFSGNCGENGTTLYWETASEINSMKFVIEKSRDLNHWIYVSEKAAAGNSNITQKYSVTDANTSGGVMYYRLVQIDFDGNKNETNPISISCTSKEANMLVFPNPSKGEFTAGIFSNESMENVELQLTDLTGKVVSSRTVTILEGNNNILFQEGNLQMGTYIIQLQGEGSPFAPVKVVIN